MSPTARAGQAGPSHGDKERVAIVLFNLGGPDRPEAIKPFLLNLFRDPAILRVPFFIRPLLARLIARARVKPATANYMLLGGKSPLLALTDSQSRALQAALPEIDATCVIAMRYWHPFSREAAHQVKAWGADRVILLPLYPQYSTTTTGSSLTAWREAAAQANLAVPTTTLCCYPRDDAYVRATADLLARTLDSSAAANLKLRVLFSAHGLPETIVAHGDPYQFQVEQTVASVVRVLGREIDYRICYQSRATPQVWIAPSTEESIAEAAKDGVGLVVQPIAFVSEHSETLVELDVEYRELTEKLGIRHFFRVPAQNDDAGFIAALAGLVRLALQHGVGLCSFAGQGICRSAHRDCPHVKAGLPRVAEGTEPQRLRVAA
jgi:protoporphyrin/coproporphyrin ferrochelatase